MKVIPYYKKQSFAPILGLSFAIHAAVLAGSGLWSPLPEYGVVRAPSSVEVVLTEVFMEKEQVEKPEDKVLTAQNAEPVVDQLEEKPVEPVKEEQAAVVSPPEKGAVQEKEPEYLRNPAPAYPRLARQRGWEGSVLLRVYVDTNGLPSELEVKESSGHRVLDQAAVRAVSDWKFKPASMNSAPIGAWIEIPVRFILEG